MKKVTFIIGIVSCFNVASCKTQAERNMELDVWQQKIDSMGNATLDSVYKKQVKECDSLQKMKIPILVDSLLRSHSIKKLLEK